MKFAAPLLVASSLVAGTFAGPSRLSEDAGLDKRAGVNMCGQWDNIDYNSGLYRLYNNMWGQGDATSFSQCTQQLSSPSSVRDAPSFAGLNLKRTLINHSSKQTKIAWKTTYAYTGGFAKVKSYPNVALLQGLGKPISQVKTIPSNMYWTYTTASNPLVADVSYDLWLSDNNGKHIYEIMIWLSSRGGAGPAGGPIGTTTIAGYSFTLYKGIVGDWTVFSYVPSKELTSFKTDLKLFITPLIEKQGVSSSLLLTDVQAGTEPFEGSATLTVTEYQAKIKY